MSQRNSGYIRRERDLYETPEWVTHALLPFMRPVASIWEPAAASGRMVRVLQKLAPVRASDIDPGGVDFLMTREAADAIVTNPPYELAQQFIEHALRATEKSAGVVAMLLRTDYDHAKTRHHLFGGCPQFARKVVLLRRIVWFEGGSSPSFNHAWFVWDWQNHGQPVLSYGGNSR